MLLTGSKSTGEKKLDKGYFGAPLSLRFNKNVVFLFFG